MVKAVKDCLVFGTGFVKTYADQKNNIHVERVFPGAVWSEMWDGREGKPRTLVQMDYADRDVLAARYPNAATQLASVLPLSEQAYTTEAVGTNVIPFYEGWHLPSGPGIKDGKHVVCVAGAVLLEEDWTADTFPFAIIRFDDSLAGFYGRGIAELGFAHQSALTQVQRAEYQAWSQTGLFKYWVDINSKINEQQLISNQSGIVVRGIGNPPQVINPPAVHPQFVEYKQDIITQFFNFIGVSQLSASGNKPVGLNSGAALREAIDIQSDRFSLLSQKWQQMFVDLAGCLIQVARTVYTKDKKFSVNVKGKSFLSKIPWKDVDMEEDCYTLEIFPINSLPHTPAGKLDTVTQYLQANLITPQEGKKLLSVPDLDETMSLENAQMDNAKFTAYRMLHKGEYLPPDNLQNIPLCVTVVQQEALKALDAGCPPERIDLCRKWLIQAKMLLTPAPQSPAPNPGSSRWRPGCPSARITRRSICPRPSTPTKRAFTIQETESIKRGASRSRNEINRPYSSGFESQALH